MRGLMAGFQFHGSTCQGVYQLMVVIGLSTSMLGSLEDWSLKASLGESEPLELEDEEEEEEEEWESAGAVTKLASELGVEVLWLDLARLSSNLALFSWGWGCRLLLLSEFSASLFSIPAWVK